MESTFTYDFGLLAHNSSDMWRSLLSLAYRRESTTAVGMTSTRSFHELHDGA